jgi:hypothetical protein
MTIEQLQQFDSIVNDVKVDHNKFTTTIPSKMDGVGVNTFTGDSDTVWLNIKLGGFNNVGACMTPEQAMAVAASLVAQVLRIANAKDAEQ